jgi:hypothetical protein
MSADVHCTTCEQAEVLYPGEVPTIFLEKMFVSSDDFADELAAQILTVNHPAVPIEVCPAMFGEIK